MTGHALDRLEDRFHMSKDVFEEAYKLALKSKAFFKREFQGYIKDGTVSVCVKIRNIMVIVVLRKINGVVVTLMLPETSDFLKAKELGWNIVYPYHIRKQL